MSSNSPSFINNNQPNTTTTSTTSQLHTPPDSPSLISTPYAGLSHQPEIITSYHPANYYGPDYMNSDNGEEFEHSNSSTEESSGRLVEDEDEEVLTHTHHTHPSHHHHNPTHHSSQHTPTHIPEEDPNAVHVKERTIIYQILSKVNREGPIAGRYYFILCNTWWKSWKRYVGYENRNTVGHYDRPGPMENAHLLDEDGEVKRSKQEDIDFVFVPHDMWGYLFDWYGGGPTIPRPCISMPRIKQQVIEVRKLPLKVIWSRKPKEPYNASFSKATTIGEFIEEMSKTIKLDRENIRVFDFHNGSKIKELYDLRTTFYSVPIIENQYILIEQRTKKGNWPNPKIYSRYTQSAYYKQDPTDPGKTGLANLGNTCFMSSSLQCLSQTVPLVDYFLTKEYIKDINRENPLGQKG